MTFDRFPGFSLANKSRGTSTIFLATVLAIWLGSLLGCGGGTTAMVPRDNPITRTSSITITPSDTTVKISFPDAPRTLQFSASVQNAVNTKVTWQVNSVTGGNEIWGTISETGLYTAPTDPPMAYTNITAVLASDPRYSATVILGFTCDQRAALKTPEGTSVEVNGRLPLVLTVEDTCHAYYPKVSWSIDGLAMGSTRGGVIIPSSQVDQVWYYPPASVPAAPVTVTASFQDIMTGNFSERLSVTGNSQELLAVSPSELTIGLAQRQEFKLLRGGAEVPANWQVNGQQGIDANSGWIINSVYRSPYREPDPNPVIVTGVDKSATPNRYAWGLVTVKAPGESDNSSLKGTFAMQLGGYIGAITFDGNGGISGTAETYVRGLDTVAYLKTAVSGTYRLGFDRQLVIHARYSSSSSTAPVEADWHFVLISNNYAQGIDTSGFLERQNIVGLTTDTFAGTYVTVLNESIPCYAYVCWPGDDSRVFFGAVRPLASGELGGQLEANGAPVRLSGTFSIGNDGTGTIDAATMGSELSLKGSVVAVSQNKFLMMGNTQLGTFAGTAERQIGPVSEATLKGPYIFSSSSMLGRFEADGAGYLSGIYDSGSVQLYGGYSFVENTPFSATYTVDEWGRTLVRWVGSDVTDAFYLVSPAKYIEGGGAGYAQLPVATEGMLGRYASCGLPWMVLDENHYAVGVMTADQASFDFEYVPPVTEGNGKGSIVGEVGSSPFIFPPFYVVSRDKVIFMGKEVNRIQE